MPILAASSPVDREALHAEIEAYGMRDEKGEAVLHALVDLGLLTSFSCQYESCVLGGAPFADPRDRLRKAGLQLDHIVPRREGGGNRVENLRPVHAACNAARNRTRRPITLDTTPDGRKRSRRGGPRDRREINLVPRDKVTLLNHRSVRPQDVGTTAQVVDVHGDWVLVDLPDGARAFPGLALRRS